MVNYSNPLHRAWLAQTKDFQRAWTHNQVPAVSHDTYQPIVTLPIVNNANGDYWLNGVILTYFNGF